LEVEGSFRESVAVGDILLSHELRILGGTKDTDMNGIDNIECIGSRHINIRGCRGCSCSIEVENKVEPSAGLFRDGGLRAFERDCVVTSCGGGIDGGCSI